MLLLEESSYSFLNSFSKRLQRSFPIGISLSMNLPQAAVLHSHSRDRQEETQVSISSRWLCLPLGLRETLPGLPLYFSTRQWTWPQPSQPWAAQNRSCQFNTDTAIPKEGKHQAARNMRKQVR